MSLEEFKAIDAKTLPVGKLITMAARGLNIYVNRHLDELNINGTQLHLLFEIAHQKNINQDKIASRCNINKSVVARSIRKLEEKSLVKRQIDENNRRQNMVSLTDEGKKTLSDAIEILNAWEDEIIGNDNSVDKEELQKSLKQIVIRIIEINMGECKNE